MKDEIVGRPGSISLVRVCIWEDCEKTDVTGIDGWCMTHYHFMYNNRRDEMTLAKRGVRPSDPDKPTVCMTCGETKPESRFELTEKGFVSSKCKTCWWHYRQGYTRRRLAEDPEFVRAGQDRRYRWNYGIGLKDYEAMVAACGGRCHLCHRKPPKGKLHVDHDHDTDKIRGLLCWRCNVGLGFIEGMAPDGDMSAILDYLALGKLDERAS